MTDSDTTYTAATVPLVGALALAIVTTLFTSGAVQIAAVVVLVLLIGALGAVIGSQVTMHKIAAEQAAADIDR